MSQSFSDGKTFVDLLQQHAEEKGDQRLFTLLLDGEKEEATLSYKKLDRQAKAIASTLQAAGLTGHRALIACPLGLEFITAFFGCLYAGVIAVPAPSLDPSNLKASILPLEALVRDTEATTVITTSPIISMGNALFELAPHLMKLHWRTVEDLTEAPEGDWREPELTPDTLAFLQYTSGSTGSPKGVMLSHRNLNFNCSEIHRLAGHHSKSVCVSWLPMYHNMGLIGGILIPLFGGFEGVLMSPLHFLLRPMRWLEAISRFGGTTSPLPNFALDLCVKRFDPKQYPHLDLSTWEVACCGGEPIRPETLHRFAEVFAPFGFRKEVLFPAYGLAEGTLMVTSGSRLEGPKIGRFDEASLARHRAVDAVDPQTPSSNSRSLVSCGRTLRDQILIIVHPETKTRCEEEEVGEIWVAGPGVAQGYWNRPSETEATFSSFLSETGEGPFLRTGDLGFLKKNELFITGRLKDLIILGGKNYYPQDIEQTAEQCHPSLRSGCCAAFSIDVDGEEKLLIAVELERRRRAQTPALERRAVVAASELTGPLNVQEVIEGIRKTVAQHHQLPVHTILLLKAGSLPKTPGGKIQRRACRADFLSHNLKIIAVDSVEEWRLESQSRRAYAEH